MVLIMEEQRRAGVDPVSLIGQEIRSTNPYAYRTGEWAKIAGVRMVTPEGLTTPRLVWDMVWPDGVEDSSPIYNSGYEYEFRIDWVTKTA